MTKKFWPSRSISQELQDFSGRQMKWQKMAQNDKKKSVAPFISEIIHHDFHLWYTCVKG